MRLVRAELLKLRTTNAWWLFTLTALVLTGLTFLINMLQTGFALDNPGLVTQGMNDAQAEQARATLDPVNIAANLSTSGQFLSLMVVLVLGIMVVTSEFFHQTATTTFLTTPHRSTVIAAKLATGALVGALLWLVNTLLTLPLTALFLGSRDLSVRLTEGPVIRTLLLNLLAYVLWAVFGVGFGVLLRSQIAATVTGIVLYLAGFIGALIIFNVLADRLDAPWLLEWQVIVPSIASQLMVSGSELPGNPPQWLGAVVLASYAAVSAAVGTLIVRTRDIS
jgi:ABC-type transport system involved in multi-copper enzyme maturation permease subunit